MNYRFTKHNVALSRNLWRNSTRSISISSLQEIGVKILNKHGVKDKQARQVMDVLLAKNEQTFFKAEARGHGSHGLLRLERLITGIKSGTHYPNNEVLMQEHGNWLVVDGQNSLGPAVCTDVTEKCIEIAKKDGIAIASIKNITHFGFGGFYTELATKSNLIGLALCNTEPAAAPFGGKGKVLGTNPISFSVPRLFYTMFGIPPSIFEFLSQYLRKNNYPITVDLATTAAARGKLLQADLNKTKLPDFIAVDKDGNMTNDAKEGALCPLGGAFGYKGTGLGIMVDLLSGVLSNSATGKRVTGTATTTVINTSGSFFLFLNPEVSCGDLDTYFNNVDELMSDITSAGPNVLLPGQKEQETLQKIEKEGINLPDGTAKMLEKLQNEE